MINKGKLTFESFVEFYDKYGKTPNQISKPKNKFNEQQLRTKYSSYSKAYNKKIEKLFKVDDHMDEVFKFVDERDKNTCRLLNKLSTQELFYISQTVGNYFLTPLDHAHILPRSTHPHLKYDVDNIILLSRLFHSRLDKFRDPITGEYIGKVMASEWWKFILGSPQFNSLLEKQ